MSIQEVKTKLYRYCAYQERCHQEVEQKLRDLGIYGDAAQEVITHLISENFLNEERFAKIYTASKFRLKHWGRLRIVRELEQRNLSRHCIRAGLTEIKEDEYRVSLRALLEKKASLLDLSNIYTLRDRVSKFAIQKGFEPELVWSELKQLLPDR